ncbi:unnamed protein product [Thelazia callipaeda]|uniref:RNASEK-C17orf49 readthrough (Non-protein coding) n=1 Tax=Thelazia callipaeda TaxID=103827 RepID=A0A0N5CT06_THECL|nr:unnamed protein product [Thelazia callipaeda]
MMNSNVGFKEVKGNTDFTQNMKGLKNFVLNRLSTTEKVISSSDKQISSPVLSTGIKKKVFSVAPDIVGKVTNSTVGLNEGDFNFLMKKECHLEIVEKNIDLSWNLKELKKDATDEEFSSIIDDISEALSTVLIDKELLEASSITDKVMNSTAGFKEEMNTETPSNSNESNSFVTFSTYDDKKAMSHLEERVSSSGSENVNAATCNFYGNFVEFLDDVPTPESLFDFDNDSNKDLSSESSDLTDDLSVFKLASQESGIPYLKINTDDHPEVVEFKQLAASSLIKRLTDVTERLF